LAVSERKTYEISELIKRPSKICNTKYTLNMMKGLELDCEVLLDRLIAMSLILAEKFYAEEQNTL
jgi:hypothetical protein